MVTAKKESKRVFEFHRIRDFALIPKKFLKAIDGYELDTELLYYSDIGRNAAADPMTLLYALVDITDHSIHGFVWGQVQIFSRSVHINAIAVDKAAQTSNGQVVAQATDLFRGLLEDSNFSKLTMSSFRPRAFEHWGFKPVEKLKHMRLDLGDSDESER
tara:strand:- start:170 stop:646 length:477 start_codon:yes stop_codon:yes gene_type:complete